MNILEIPFIAKIRRNHALEHATIHVLTQHNPRLQIIGRTTPQGFYIYGQVGTEEVKASALEALSRLRSGEKQLAIHPRCGTNLAIAGVLAGLSSFVAMWKRTKSRLARLPQVLLAAIAGVIIAQPIGFALQMHITTSQDMKGVTIGKITRLRKGKMVIHRVEVKSVNR
jgi:hypothetical protein